MEVEVSLVWRRMPSIKVYPPKQLPDRGVTETQFDIWIEELEVYISQEDDLSMFLPGGRYEKWLPAEESPNRLDDVDEKDRVYKLFEFSKKGLS